MSGVPKPLRPRAWITGAAGLIGHYLAHASTQFDIIPLARTDLDLTNFAAVDEKFRHDRPQLILHCAAMSKSPDCQANPTRARAINVDATAHLAALAADCRLVFFSTDLVFDGSKGNYIEIDAVNPLSIYAETKVAAEKFVLKNPRHIVLRTSLNSGASPGGRTTYNEQLRDAWQREKTAKLFVDEFRCPIAATVTARATWEVAESDASGLFHLAGAEHLSRLQIGRLLAARHPELNARIDACSLAEYDGPPRPPDTSLNCAKVQKLLSFPLPGLTQWLHDHPEDAF
ncbi:MAG TPA: SDR family oxidoreductase [Verrucomicrobiae bacterium]|nr:SDR family oxidoreductase [Verrucomicrobiae bacterium]